MSKKGMAALAMMTALASGINLKGSDYYPDKSGDHSQPSTLTEKERKKRKNKNKARKKANKKNRKH